MTYQMIGYIHEGPQALGRTLEATEQPVLALAARVRKSRVRRIFLTGIGSSYTAAMMALPVFRYHCRLPTHVLPGNELDYYASRWLDERALVIAVSRSGERGAVVDVLTQAVERGALGVAVTAAPQGLLAQKAHMALITAEGPESTWPKTKSVVAATGLLIRLGLALAAPGDAEVTGRLAALRALPRALQAVLEASEPWVQNVMPEIQDHERVALAGTGGNYGAAIEGAMKLMESASISTRYDTTDGLLSGPLGGMDPRWLVLPLVTATDLEPSAELLRVARQLGVRTLAISAAGLDLGDLADELLALPAAPDPLLAALPYLVPLQLLTYYWTVGRGLNPDEPAAKGIILDALLPPGRQEPR
jgi:glucosamine--fructose-6-phosphate aminotransferase (isomerizing)